MNRPRSFDPAEDVVTVAGEMNGWSSAADTLFQGFTNPDLYSNVVIWKNAELPKDGETKTIGYKFVIGQPNETAPGGWEAGDNRTFVLTGKEVDTDNNGYREIEVSPRYYNDIGPDQVFTTATTLTVEVDLRPAMYFLKDNGRLPFDTQSGDPANTIDNLVIMGPAANAFDSLDPWPWGNVPAGRQLKDDGQNGDTMAGDSLYTIRFEYAPGTGRTLVGKFGINGLDNEAVVQGDTYFDFGAAADSDGRVRHIFGAIRRPDGRYTDLRGPSTPGSQTAQPAYDPYIAISADSLTATVVRRGASAVGVEDLGLGEEALVAGEPMGVDQRVERVA